MTNDGSVGYSWVDANSEVSIASCFSFFQNLSVENLLYRIGIRDLTASNLQLPGQPTPNLADEQVVGFAMQDWGVLYEPYGYPERFANLIAASTDVDRCVIVFWDVNAVTEFALWEHGTQIVAFEWPDDRRGTEPDRLVSQMRETVGIERTGIGPAFYRYQQMLALAERITGVQIAPDFLQGPSVVVGYIPADDKRGADGAGAMSELQHQPTCTTNEADARSWAPEERRRNKEVLATIPKDRWVELPVRLARIACEYVGIAEEFPLTDILDSLEREQVPDPFTMTVPSDVYALVVAVTFGLGAPSEDQVLAAIEATFAAAKAKSRRSPLEVLRLARYAAEDHGIRVLDQVRGDMGLKG